MGTIIAYCGLNCSECDAYKATQANDTAALQAVAEKWSKEFGANCTAELCICDGCSATGRISTAYANVCPIRACASAKGNITCAHCDDFACDTLINFWQYAPALKEKLEVIRKELGK